MKHFIRISILLFSFLDALSGFGQAGKVLVRNNPANNNSATASIQLKWYDENTLFKNVEVNVYRRTGTGVWKKLNVTSIKKGSFAIPKEAIAKDSSLVAFSEMMKNVPDDSLHGFFLLTLVLKSFQSETFAKHAGIMFEDQEVEKGKKYQYKVMLVKNGKETQLGVSKEIVCGNYIPPLPPKDVVIKSRKRSTEFKWKLETDRFYAVNIYRVASDSTQEIRVTKQPIMVSKKVDKYGNKSYGEAFYTDKGLRENVTYTYRLTALDFFGTETDFTSGIPAFIADSTAPAPPTNLWFEVKKNDVNLKWQMKADSDLSGFYIYKGKSSTGSFQRVNSQIINPDQTTYKDESPSGDFYYYIASTDKAGNENASNKIFVHVHDVIPPDAPQNFQVRADTGTIYLNWLPNKETDLMGYQIYRSVDNEDTTHFVLLNSKPSIDPFYIDTLSKNIKNKFMYKVVAVDSSYNKSIPSKVAGAQMPDVTPPEQPVIKNAYMDNAYLRIEWIANADDDLWGYNLYRSSEKDSAAYQQVNINLLPAHSVHYTDQRTEVGMLYNYYLVAIDSSGNHSVPSVIYAVRNTDTSATSKKILTSTKGKYIKKTNQVHLEWEAAASNILGVVVYRKEKDQEVYYPLTGLLTSSEYTDKDIRKSNTYYYEVRLYRASGAVEKSTPLRIETDK